MIDLVFNNSQDESFKTDFFNKILETSVGILGISDRNIEVSINIVNEDKIRELNKQYRNKDKVTDVLSFPMQSKGLHHPKGMDRFEGPFGYAQGPMSNAEAFDIGDIFVCLPFAKIKAKSENIDIDRKIIQLVVHGFLHLLGYDHEKTEEDAKEMFGLENKILSKLNF